MGIEDLFPKPEETYEEWIIRLSLEDNDRHRELFFVFQKNWQKHLTKKLKEKKHNSVGYRKMPFNALKDFFADLFVGEYKKRFDDQDDSHKEMLVMMKEYIQFCADRLLIALGYSKLYLTSNPFPWMDMISLEGKTNFFEKRVGEYQKAGVMASLNNDADDRLFNMDEDF